MTKFRIWNPDGNKHLYDVENVYECLKQQLVHDGNKTRGFTPPYDHSAHGMIWEQFVRADTYAGITTEFYVGDIVTLRIPYHDKEYVAEIFYDKASCAFRAKIHKENGTYIDFLTVLTVTKVIGNIHKNF